MAKFQKGKSGNPGGRKPLPPELKAISEITGHELKRIISKYCRMTRAELEKVAKDPNVAMIDLAIASILAKSVSHGDYGRLGFLMDRSIGKPDVAPNDLGGESSGNVFEMKYKRNSKKE